MDETIKQVQVSIRVDEDLYARYKAALWAERPRSNTTRDLTAHMWATVDKFEAAEAAKAKEE